jgi:hypothetical protein
LEVEVLFFEAGVVFEAFFPGELVEVLDGHFLEVADGEVGTFGLLVSLLSFGVELLFGGLVGGGLVGAWLRWDGGGSCGGCGLRGRNGYGGGSGGGGYGWGDGWFFSHGIGSGIAGMVVGFGRVVGLIGGFSGF